MHKDKREQKIKGRGTPGKALVMGLRARQGEVRATVISDRERTTLQPKVREHVQPGSEVFTDEPAAYTGLDPERAHQVINHAEQYVDGNVHTNNLENYWSLLKRMIHGTHAAVEPIHLFRYLDEESHRYNTPKATDGQRFRAVIRRIVGKRMTYADLIGADADLPGSAGASAPASA